MSILDLEYRQFQSDLNYYSELREALGLRSYKQPLRLEAHKVTTRVKLGLPRLEDWQNSSKWNINGLQPGESRPNLAEMAKNINVKTNL